MDPVFALIDGNSFFASCEKVFRPDLAHTPVVVLSNNDGCVVARSAEAKKLGIKMCQPFFEIEDFCKKNGVVAFSSNYELYGDLSGRMISAIASLVPAVEQYSIDEAFADMSGLSTTPEQLTTLGTNIKERVLQWVGIPTCVGIAPTKTLAKYCNHLAKKFPSLNGVCNWFELSADRRQKALMCQPVDEIWGVGRRLKTRLNSFGIYTAWDLTVTPPDWIRKQFSLVLAQTVLELRGESCLPLEEVRAQRKQVVRSRSFNQLISTEEELEGAIIFHAEETARTLRKEKTAAHVIGIILNTNPFREHDLQYHIYPAKGLNFATNDSKSIIEAACDLLHTYFRPGYLFKRAGVYASEVVPMKSVPMDLFEEEQRKDRQKLSDAVDAINRRFGKYCLCYAGSKLSEEQWRMARYRLSPAYTTCLADIPQVA